MKRQYIKTTIIFIFILLSVLCIISVVRDNNQAKMPIPYKVEFTGEYSYDGQNSYPYGKDDFLSALDGDVVVKGHFDTEIPEGVFLSFYNNHTGIIIYVNGELIYKNIVAELDEHGIPLFASACGKKWEHVRCPNIGPGDEVEFRLSNPHSYGNRHAYNEVFATLYMTPDNNIVLENYLMPHTRPFRIIGYGLLIVAIMLLGASLSAAILHSSIAGRLFKKGMVTAFAGGYMIFDIMIVYLLEELLAVRTYGRSICMMLFVYFSELVIRDTLEGIKKKIADYVLILSGAANVVMLAIVVAKDILIFDMLPYWVITQLIACPVLIVLCMHEMLKGEKTKRVEQFFFILLLVAVLSDITGIGYAMYSQALCTKIIFLVVLISYTLRGVKQVIVEHHASLKNEQLQEELENSRIAVMISQIQPHFLYNSLTSMMDLCDNNPKRAKDAIADFADYLRGNIASLKADKPIPFETELEHIKRYLRLEKLRFDEELQIKYDIQTLDFMVPALSVQPLVENAVKHGVGRKTGGGMVAIQTTETETEYLIYITDDGVGFTEGEYSDSGSTHIGLENIKKRLKIMMNAQIEIESTKGVGTIALVRIPKRRD